MPPQLQTSESHPLAVQHFLDSGHHGLPGRLGLIQAPGRADFSRTANVQHKRSLKADLAALAAQNYSVVLVLLQDHEIRSICRAAGPGVDYFKARTKCILLVTFYNCDG